MNKCRTVVILSIRPRRHTDPYFLQFSEFGPILAKIEMHTTLKLIKIKA